MFKVPVLQTVGSGRELLFYHSLALATNIRNWSPNHFYQIDILENLLALIQNKMEKKDNTDNI
jgi:hypothetical protein